MKQSPSQSSSFSASQRISCILWSLKVHNHFYKSLPPIPVLSQINLVHTIPSYSFKICINIILKPMCRSPKRSVSFLELLIIPWLLKTFLDFFRTWIFISIHKSHHSSLYQARWPSPHCPTFFLWHPCQYYLAVHVFIFQCSGILCHVDCK